MPPSGRLIPEGGFRRGANSLDALRLLLALAVVLSHAWPLLGRPEPLDALTGGRVSLGGLAVGGFFGLSGLLVARSRERVRSGAEYLLRRARRIVPGYLAACLATAGLIAAFDPAGVAALAGIEPLRYVRDSLLLLRPRIPGSFAGNPIPGEPNGPLYTVAFEFGFYVLLAGAYRLGLFARRGVVLALAGLAVALWAGLPPIPGRLGWYLTTGAAFLPPFLLGVLAWLYRDRLPFSRGLAVGAGGLLALAPLLPGRAMIPALWIGGGYLLLVAAFRAPGLLSAVMTRGDVSYGTYLYAWPVAQILVARLGDRLEPGTLFLASSVGALALGAVSRVLVEAPFLRSRRALRDPVA